MYKQDIYIYKYSWHVDIYLDEVEKRERGVLLLFKKFALLCGKKYFTLEGCTATQLDRGYDDSRDYYWKRGNIV